MKIYISSEIVLWFGLLLFGISGFFLTFIFPEPQGFYAFVEVAAFGGFGVSTYIYYTKSRGKHLVCPAGVDCDAVVKSRYAKFFGIPLEYLGMLYFAVIFLSYALMLLSPQLFEGNLHMALLLLTMAASLFSGYLLFVQAFLLRKWCIWCVLASMFSLTIFFFALVSSMAAVAFLAHAEAFLVMLKFLGFVLGMGGATAMVFLFSQFLKDLDIDEKEVNAIQVIAESMWVGLALSLMSQFALYVGNPIKFGDSPVFLAQMIALFGAAFASAVFMIIYAPFLAYVPFDKKPTENPNAGFGALRRPTFMVGALALFSWYFAFITNFIPEYRLPLLLGAYGTVLVVAVLGSTVWERQYRKKL